MFDGSKEEWVIWNMKFSAFASTNDFMSQMIGLEPVPNRFKENLNDEELGRIKRHDLGFAELLIAMEDRKNSLLIGRSISKENPRGDLRLAWERLEKSINPKT